jgi:hypothetical protein
MRGREAIGARGGDERLTAGRGACPLATSRGSGVRDGGDAIGVKMGSAGMSKGGASGRIVLRRGLACAVGDAGDADASGAGSGAAREGSRSGSPSGFAS